MSVVLQQRGSRVHAKHVQPVESLRLYGDESVCSCTGCVCSLVQVEVCTHTHTHTHTHRGWVCTYEQVGSVCSCTFRVFTRVEFVSVHTYSRVGCADCLMVPESGVELGLRLIRAFIATFSCGYTWDRGVVVHLVLMCQ